MRTGVQRLYAALPDIHVDLPPAYTLAERWIGLLAAAPPLVDAATVRALPKGYVHAIHVYIRLLLVVDVVDLCLKVTVAV